MRKPIGVPKEKLINFSTKDAARLLIVFAFAFAIYAYTSSIAGDFGVNSMMLVIAAVIGGYMAINIGANDVANNVGPAVGSGAMTLLAAIAIAAVCEASGAIIAGGDVVKTIKKGIIDPQMIPDAQTFIWAMTAALLAAAVWLNIATYLGAPVSTTHSIVGGVVGAGIAAGGWAIVDWGKMQQIVASWVISPAMGGAIAASFLYAVERAVLDQSDMKTAAKKVVPFLIGIMAAAFTTYMILKGLKKFDFIKNTIDFPKALIAGLAVGLIIWVIVRKTLLARADHIENSRTGIDNMFTIPLIISAAFLSFAHGANDVANAVGPLAAITESVLHGGIAASAPIPLWVMLIGAFGIALGLALYGPKLIKTVGTEITELDKVRAFCVALAAAITVIIASQLGLPVSSTHIAVGGIFGVGFLRENLESKYNHKLAKIRNHMTEVEKKDNQEVEDFITKFDKGTVAEKKAFLKELKEKARADEISWWQRRQVKKAYKAKLVERSMLFKIIAAWIFTVPLSAIFSAALFFMIRGILVPGA